MIRRLPTATFALRAADHLQNAAQLRGVLELPMLADIFATLDGPRPFSAFILAAYQTFKSAAGQLHLLRNCIVRPGPALWYTPTKDFSKDFADLKLNPLADALPGIRALTYPDRAATAKLRRNLAGGASILILSAHTENDRTGKTARDLYLDEAHLFEDGHIEQIRNRRGAYPDDWLELFMSTGLTAGTDAHREWIDTDQRVWHLRCPACHRLIEPRFAHYGDPADPHRITGGLRYERHLTDDGLPDFAKIAATLVHECPHCHHTLPDSPASRHALSGTLRHPRGIYVITNPAATPRHYGWRTHGICTRAWLPIVIRYEKALLARSRGDITEQARCVREDFADIWNPAEQLAERKLRPIGDYLMADPTDPAALADWWSDELRDPQARPYRFATVDVQQDHFVYLARSWGHRSQSRLLYTEKVTTPARIDDLNHALGVLAQRTFLDCRHTPQYVRQLCSRYGWRALEGEPEKDYLHKTLGLRRIYSEPRPIDPWQGTAHQGQTTILQFQFSKPSALERWHLLRTLETNDGQPLWTAASDAPEWYFREIEAYHRIIKRLANGGTALDWHVHGPDHAADCEAMGVVVASMASLVGAESIDTPTPPEAGKS